LARRVPDLNLESLSVLLNGPDLEINANRRDERFAETPISEPL
jgi:hypothetical protein